jgi:hypothetical protein
MRKAKIAAISAAPDKWIQRATAAAVAAAQDIIGDMSLIRPSVPIGRITSQEWGWICMSAISAWIAVRSRQAAEEGWNTEHAIRTTGLAPDPWDAGAIASILPTLAEACSDHLDWAQPIGTWSKDEITEFLLVAFGLIQGALAARDATEKQVAGKTGANVTTELNDDCPF